MARKMLEGRNSPDCPSPKVIDAAGVNNMTGTATVLSNVIDMRDIDLVGSLEIQISGTPTGTLTLLGSNQYDRLINPGTGANANAQFASLAVPLAAGAVTPALPGVAGAGSSTICALAAQALGCRYLQLRYVNTSGSGQLNAWAHGRGVS